MINIHNDCISINVNQYGGSLASFKDVKNNKELLWQGDEKSWFDQDLVLFPFVARLKNKTYTVDGKNYSMDIHGIIPYKKLEIVLADDDIMILGCKYDASTLEQYPYKFDFKVKRTIEKSTLTTEFIVENLDTKPIYFGLGGHPGLQICGNIDADGNLDTSGNYIDFGKEVTLKYRTLTPEGHFVTGQEVFGTLQKLELTKELLQKYICIILEDMPSQFDLVKRDGKKIHFNIGDVPFLGLWADANQGEYICVEPWCSLPDMLKPNQELSEKPTIIKLDVDQTYKYNFSMEVVD